MTETMIPTTNPGVVEPNASAEAALGTDNPFDPVEQDHVDNPAGAAAQRQRIGAWLDVGATSIPAFLVAVGSAIAGAVAMMIRRRRRR